MGIDIDWSGRDTHEKGIDRKTGRPVVEVSPTYYRPTEVDFLLGDPTKAKEILGWQTKIGFEELVEEMMASDLDEAKREELVRFNGFVTHMRIDERSS